jgi:hydroxyacylglutathione hydrolase
VGVSTLDVRTFPVGPLQTNSYILRAHSGASEALVVDPGEESERLAGALSGLGIERVAAILITHCHFDHIGAVAPLARALGAPVYCPRDERTVLEELPRFTPPGFGPFEGYRPEHTLTGAEELLLAGVRLEVLPTPGHSPGHLTYAAWPAGEGDLLQAPGDAPILFSGDVLFAGSVGRTDLPGADWSVLERSLALLVERFAPETLFYPGHMGASTLGRELATNPFLAGIAEQRRHAGA